MRTFVCIWLFRKFSKFLDLCVFCYDLFSLFFSYCCMGWGFEVLLSSLFGSLGLFLLSQKYRRFCFLFLAVCVAYGLDAQRSFVGGGGLTIL